MSLTNPINIRTEHPSDYEEIERLVKMSFATNNDDDGTTHEYLNELRTKDVFIADLSLVAEKDGAIIGQAVLCKIEISTTTGNRTELVLSPICVHPDYFRQGVARTMIDEVLKKAKKMGFGAVFLCGDPIVYGKLGFVPSYRYSIFHKSDAEAEWSMVRELYIGALDGISGVVDTV